MIAIGKKEKKSLKIKVFFHFKGLNTKSQSWKLRCLKCKTKLLRKTPRKLKETCFQNWKKFRPPSLFSTTFFQMPQQKKTPVMSPGSCLLKARKSLFLAYHKLVSIGFFKGSSSRFSTILFCWKEDIPRLIKWPNFFAKKKTSQDWQHGWSMVASFHMNGNQKVWGWLRWRSRLTWQVKGWCSFILVHGRGLELQVIA